MINLDVALTGVIKQHERLYTVHSGQLTPDEKREQTVAAIKEALIEYAANQLDSGQFPTVSLEVWLEQHPGEALTWDGHLIRSVKLDHIPEALND